MQDFTEAMNNTNLNLLESELKNIEKWADMRLKEEGVLFSDEVYAKLHELIFSE